MREEEGEYPDHLWSYDFLMDRTEEGSALKILPVADEYTRECLAIEVRRSMRAKDVVGTMERLFWERGEPEFARSDNGPEFIAGAVKSWLRNCGVETLYIEPDSPWENVYSETFQQPSGGRTIGPGVSTSLMEAKVLMQEHRHHYNPRRPHSALGYPTPRRSWRRVLGRWPGARSSPTKRERKV